MPHVFRDTQGRRESGKGASSTAPQRAVERRYPDPPAYVGREKDGLRDSRRPPLPDPFSFVMVREGRTCHRNNWNNWGQPPILASQLLGCFDSLRRDITTPLALCKAQIATKLNWMEMWVATPPIRLHKIAGCPLLFRRAGAPKSMRSREFEDCHGLAAGPKSKKASSSAIPRKDGLLVRCRSCGNASFSFR